MHVATELLIAASLGCSLGYVMGAIMRTGKQADNRFEDTVSLSAPKLPSVD